MIMTLFDNLIFHYLLLLYRYFYYCSSISITVYHFLLSVTVYKNSYLVWSNSQHKVTITRSREANYYTFLSNVGGTWTGTDTAFCFGPEAQYHM